MYGYNLEALPHIKDTTPGIEKIAILLIMILLLYIAYEVFLILWNNKRMEQLLDCKRRLKNYKAENKETGNRKSVKIQPKAHPEKRKTETEDLFSDEEREILKSLGR